MVKLFQSPFCKCSYSLATRSFSACVNFFQRSSKADNCEEEANERKFESLDWKEIELATFLLFKAVERRLRLSGGNIVKTGSYSRRLYYLKGLSYLKKLFILGVRKSRKSFRSRTLVKLLYFGKKYITGKASENRLVMIVLQIQIQHNKQWFIGICKSNLLLFNFKLCEHKKNNINTGLNTALRAQKINNFSTITAQFSN